jgi:hypothetical protein
VVLLIDAHAGRDGEALQPVIAAPFELRLVGASDIGIPTVPPTPEAPTKLREGTCAEADKVTVVEPDPEELVAVTV